MSHPVGNAAETLNPLYVPIMGSLEGLERDVTEGARRAREIWDREFGGSGGGSNMFTRTMGSADEAGNKMGAIAGRVSAMWTQGMELAEEGAEKLLDVGKDLIQEFFEIGETWENVTRTLRATTTATGADLEGLQNTVSGIAKNTSASIDTIAQAVGVLHQRTGLAGDQLKQLATDVVDAQKVFGQAINMEQLTGMVKVFGGNVQETDQVLNQLAMTSRATGMQLPELIEMVSKGGAQMRQFGENIGPVSALLAQFNQEGVQGPRALMAMNRAMAEAVKMREPFGQFLEEQVDKIQKLFDAGGTENTQAAQTLAERVFGTRGGAQLATLIQDHVLTVQQLKGAFVDLGDAGQESISDIYKSTRTLSDRVEEMKHQLADSLQPFTERVMDDLGPALQHVADWMSNHESEMAGFFVRIGDVVGAVTEGVVRATGEMIGALGKMAPVLSGLDRFGAGVADLLGNHDFANRSRTEADNIDRLGQSWQQYGQQVEGWAGKMDGYRNRFRDWGAELQQQLKYQDDLNAALQSQPDGKGITLKSNAATVIADLTQLGLHIDQLQDQNHTIVITADTQQAADQAKKWAEDTEAKNIKIVTKPNPQQPNGDTWDSDHPEKAFPGMPGPNQGQPLQVPMAPAATPGMMPGAAPGAMPGSGGMMPGGPGTPPSPAAMPSGPMGPLPAAPFPPGAQVPVMPGGAPIPPAPGTPGGPGPGPAGPGAPPVAPPGGGGGAPTATGAHQTVSEKFGDWDRLTDPSGVQWWVPTKGMRKPGPPPIIDPQSKKPPEGWMWVQTKEGVNVLTEMDAGGMMKPRTDIPSPAPYHDTGNGALPNYVPAPPKIGEYPDAGQNPQFYDPNHKQTVTVVPEAYSTPLTSATAPSAYAPAANYGGYTGGYGAAAIPTNPEGWRPTVRAVLNSVLPAYGLQNEPGWENAIIKQIETESGGRITDASGRMDPRTNTSDSNAAAGHPSTGLLQFIDSTYLANNIGDRAIDDPIGQIAAVVPYVVHKYGLNEDGSPKGIGLGVGYARGGTVRGFDGGGGITPAGPGLGRITTGTISAKDWAALPPGMQKLAITAWANLAAKAEGVDPRLAVPALMQVISRESGVPGVAGTGDPNIVNLWDSNATKGDPSIGLAQVTQGTADDPHNANLPGANLGDPVTNLRAALRHAKISAGGIQNVPEAHGVQEGYDTGGGVGKFGHPHPGVDKFGRPMPHDGPGLGQQIDQHPFVMGSPLPWLIKHTWGAFKQWPVLFPHFDSGGDTHRPHDKLGRPLPGPHDGPGLGQQIDHDPFGFMGSPLPWLIKHAWSEFTQWPVLFPHKDAQHHADGTWVSGGAGGIDDIPAYLTAGEFVVRKESAQKWGPVLEWINNFGHSMDSAFEHGGEVFKYDTGTGPQGAGGPPAGPQGQPIGPAVGAYGKIKTEGAQVDTIAISEVLDQMYPQIASFGLYRGADWAHEHSSGEAVDVSPGGIGTPAQGPYLAMGNEIVNFALTNADQYGVQYAIWQNQMWYPGGRTEPYGQDPAHTTDAHMDHVHIRTSGGGFPAGGGPGADFNKGLPSAGPSGPQMSTTAAPMAAAVVGQGFMPTMGGPGAQMGAPSYSAGGTGGGMPSPYIASQYPGYSYDTASGRYVPASQIPGYGNYGGATAQEVEQANKGVESAQGRVTSSDVALGKLKDKVAEEAAPGSLTPPDTMAGDQAALTQALAENKQAHDDLTTALQHQNEILNKPPPTQQQMFGAGGAWPGESSAQAFGSSFLGGVMQSLGFDDKLFKNPLNWGIFKLGIGAFNYAGGLMQAMHPGQPMLPGVSNSPMGPGQGMTSGAASGLGLTLPNAPLPANAQVPQIGAPPAGPLAFGGGIAPGPVPHFAAGGAVAPQVHDIYGIARNTPQSTPNYASEDFASYMQQSMLTGLQGLWGILGGGGSGGQEGLGGWGGGMGFQGGGHVGPPPFAPMDTGGAYHGPSHMPGTPFGPPDPALMTHPSLSIGDMGHPSLNLPGASGAAVSRHYSGTALGEGIENLLMTYAPKAAPVVRVGGPVGELAVTAAQGIPTNPLLHPTRGIQKNHITDWVNAGSSPADKAARIGWANAHFGTARDLDRTFTAPAHYAAGSMVDGGHGGIDDVPAMLTAGEFVMNKQATNMFLPQLRAMNARYFAAGGEVYSPYQAKSVSNTNIAGPDGLTFTMAPQFSGSRGQQAATPHTLRQQPAVVINYNGTVHQGQPSPEAVTSAQLKQSRMPQFTPAGGVPG